MNISKTIVGDALAGTREVVTETRSIFGLEIIRRPDPNNEIVNNALQSNSKVRVFKHRRLGRIGRLLFWGFEPLQKDDVKGVGIILYPGTLVDVRAYAPIAHQMAENGYHAAIVTPPLSLSFADADLANDVIKFKGWENKLDINAWAVSGHSQGGAFACKFANDNRGTTVKAVVLLAAYGAESFNLSDSDFKVVSIYGSVDGIALYEDVVVEGAKLLPPTTKFVKIEGGNHTQFSYVEKLQQSGKKVDGVASMTVEEQQEIICQNLLSLLSEL